MKKRAVIFDFDGTLADTFALVVDIFYQVTNRKEPIPPHEISRLRELSLPEVAKELHVPLWKIPYLGFRGKRMLTRMLDQAPIVPGTERMLKQLRRRNYELYIVSSNSARNIRKFLQMHHLEGYFADIHGNARLGGKGHFIKKICRDGGYDRARTCYVGDEVRDIEAARHAGLRSVAVAWGYNNIRALNRHQPHKIIFEPDELAKYLATIKA